MEVFDRAKHKLEIGDVIAYAVRSGNSGELRFGIVRGFREIKPRYSWSKGSSYVVDIYTFSYGGELYKTRVETLTNIIRLGKPDEMTNEFKKTFSDYLKSYETLSE